MAVKKIFKRKKVLTNKKKVTSKKKKPLSAKKVEPKRKAVTLKRKKVPATAPLPPSAPPPKRIKIIVPPGRILTAEGWSRRNYTQTTSKIGFGRARKLSEFVDPK